MSRSSQRNLSSFLGLGYAQPFVYDELKVYVASDLRHSWRCETLIFFYLPCRGLLDGLGEEDPGVAGGLS